MAVGQGPKDRGLRILACYYGGPASCSLSPITYARASSRSLPTLAMSSAVNPAAATALFVPVISSLAFIFGAQLAKRQTVTLAPQLLSKPCRTHYVKNKKQGLDLTARGLPLLAFISTPLHVRGKALFPSFGVFILSLRGHRGLNPATGLSDASNARSSSGRSICHV